MHYSCVSFKMCRIAHTINLFTTVLKNIWTDVGNALIQDLHTHGDAEATLKHTRMNTYTLTHRRIYLDTLLAITKFKSNLKKAITKQIKPTFLVQDYIFKGNCSVAL